MNRPRNRGEPKDDHNDIVITWRRAGEMALRAASILLARAEEVSTLLKRADEALMLPSAADDASILFSRKEVADKLHVSVHTVSHLLQTRELEGVAVGRRRMVSRASVLAYVARGGAESNDQPAPLTIAARRRGE